MIPSNNNNNNNNNELINLLINYIIHNRTIPRSSFTTMLSRDVVTAFHETCKRLNLLSSRGRSNHTLEALMVNFIEANKDSPAIVQTTLIGSPKRLQKKQLPVNVRVKTAMAKTQLKIAIRSMREGRGEKTWREGRFVAVVEKAIDIFQISRDPELEGLLEEAETLA